MLLRVTNGLARMSSLGSSVFASTRSTKTFQLLPRLPSSRSPVLVLSGDHNLCNWQSMRHNLLSIDHVAVPGALLRRGFICDDAALDMPPYQAFYRPFEPHLNKPQLIHEPGCSPPRLLIQRNVQAFEDDHAM
jgi:hypothetical protein